MEKEFVNYEIALALKELGFDEPCFGYYNIDPQLKNPAFNMVKPFEHIWCLPAPLDQQAFRWFESKGYRNYVASNQFGGKVNYWFAITPPEELTYSDSKGRNSKEEAELACLIKLIEIVKNER